MLKMALIIIVLVLAGFLAFVRLAPSDPEIWHVDPLTAKKPWRKRNVFILRDDGSDPSPPIYDVDAGTLAKAFDAFVMAKDRLERLAGSPDDLFVTYVARTKLIGYPDYVSVAFIDLGEGRSTLALFSRSRFGYGDQGVNRRRLAEWLKDFAPA